MGNLFASDPPPPPPRSPYSTRIPTPPPSPPKPPPTEFARPFPHAGFDPTYGADVLRAMFEREKEPEFDDTQEWLKSCIFLFFLRCGVLELEPTNFINTRL